MVECGSDEIAEDVMISALEFGHKSLQPMIDLQERMAAEIGKTKLEVPSFAIEEDLLEKVFKKVENPLNDALESPHTKAELNTAIENIKEELVAELAGDDETLMPKVKSAFEDAYKKVVRKRILTQGKRPDGRKLDELRPIWCDIGFSRVPTVRAYLPVVRLRC